MKAPVRVLERHTVAELLTLDDCIDAVERALAERGRGGGHASTALKAQVERGGFHVKAAVLETTRPWFVAKANANFPGNRERLGLPTIQGAILVFEGESGRLAAVMDSIQITLLRTAAATAIAARFLARDAARVVTIAGCGEQARAQLAALTRVRPIQRAFAWDREPCRADRFAVEQSVDLGLEITPIAALAQGAPHSDIVVTCTPSREFLLGPEHVRPGSFVAAIGADHPEKREIDPRLMAAAKVVVDDLAQCATFGDLHHALDAGAMARSQVHGELAEIVAGEKPGRSDEREITLFDSTGIALEDAAAAVLVVERAAARADLLTVELGA